MFHVEHGRALMRHLSRRVRVPLRSTNDYGACAHQSISTVLSLATCRAPQPSREPGLAVPSHVSRETLGKCGLRVSSVPARVVLGALGDHIQRTMRRRSPSHPRPARDGHVLAVHGDQRASDLLTGHPPMGGGYRCVRSLFHVELPRNDCPPQPSARSLG